MIPAASPAYDAARGSLWQGDPCAEGAADGMASVPEGWRPAPGEVEAALERHAALIRSFDVRPGRPRRSRP